MSELTDLVGRTFVVSVPFRWKSHSSNRLLLPSEMQTTHLFYTLRMIWNNRMPCECWVGNVKLYEFSSYYSDAYLKGAILALGAELFTRTDLPPRMYGQMLEMQAHLRRKNVQLFLEGTT